MPWSPPWVLALGGLAGFAVALGLVGWREFNRRLVLRRVLARRPVGPDGVIPGAHSISLPGGVARGALVLHGYGDTPQSVRSLCEALHRAGWAVEAPLLPGHGRTLPSLDRTDERQWLAEARAAWLALRSRHGTCVLAGQSMGGALAVLLAAEDPPAALVLVAPYLAEAGRIRRVTIWSWLWGTLMPYAESADPRSIRDPEGLIASRAYGASTARTLRALRRLVRRAAAVMPQVQAPTLVVVSPEDNRVPPAGVSAAFARLGAAEKQLAWRPGEGHVLLADRGRDAVSGLAVQWMARHAGRGRPPEDAAPSPRGPGGLSS